MLFDSNDIRTPIERIDGNLLDQIIGENTGKYPMPRSRGTSRNGRQIVRQDNRCDGETDSVRSRSCCQTRRDDRPDGETNSICSLNCRQSRRDDRRDGDTNSGCSRNEYDEYCDIDELGNRSQWGLRGYPLAIAYAPLQPWRGIMDPSSALERGTLFKDLDLPFHGSGSSKGGCCHD